MSANHSRLRLIDAKTSKEVLTGEESERQAKEEERRLKEKECEKRIAAEKQVEQLQDELNRLRKQMNG